MTATIPGSFLSLPAANQGPGLLVLYAWWGLNAFCRDFCQRLSGQGYIVLAPDLYAGRLATTIEEAKKLRSTMKQEQVSTLLLAELDRLYHLPAVTGRSVGLIGFSLGGYWASWLALQQADRVGAVTLFYATRTADYTKSRAAFQGHFAEMDGYTPVSSVRKMHKNLEAANRPAEFHTYPGTGHWFFESDRQEAYNPAAASLAWDRTLEFLQSHLSGAGGS